MQHHYDITFNLEFSVINGAKILSFLLLLIFLHIFFPPFLHSYNATFYISCHYHNVRLTIVERK